MMTSYPLAQYSWADEQVISMSSPAGQLIGTFPLSFVRDGGINMWGYVLDVVHQLVEPEDHGFIRTANGSPVVLEDQPQPGEFVLEPDSESV
jgi:hypothetical protein